MQGNVHVHGQGNGVKRRTYQPISVQITAKTDTDAILIGNTLERDHPHCAGFEIRAGDRLIYMRKSEPSAGYPPAA